MKVSNANTDQELVDAANDGSAAAFEILYLRYRDWTLQLAQRFTHDPQDALDVLQETFLYLLKKFPGFRLNARLTTFLYPAVKHLALNRRRKSSESKATDQTLDLLSAPPDTPPGSDRADLAAALGHLPHDQREVLLMRYVDDLDLTEIAAALGIPLGTVKSRIHNALSTLRSDPQAKAYFQSST